MSKSKSKKAAAIIGIIAILSLYVFSFIIGVFYSDKYPGLFLASVFLAVIIPIIVYCLVAVYKHVHKRNEYNKTNDTDDTIDAEDAEDAEGAEGAEDTVYGVDEEDTAASED